MTISPNQTLIVTMKAQQWADIITALSAFPSEIAIPLIQAMAEHVGTQAQGATPRRA